MPTYRNDTDDILHVSLGLYDRALKPGETIETVYLLDNIKGLTRVSDEPYYNPVDSVYDLSFAGAGDTKTIEIPDPFSTHVIRISDVSVDIEVFFNSEDNTPGLPLSPGDVITLRNPQVIERLVIKPTAAGACRVILIKRPMTTRM